MSGTAPKTAFVFAGGGSFGAVQVGMLRSLVAHGLRADMVVGSSVVAMNGAYYAVAPTVDGGDRLAAIWRGLRRRNVFPIAWRTLLGLPFRRDFLVGSEGLRRLVHTHLPFRNLEDAAIPARRGDQHPVGRGGGPLGRLRGRRHLGKHGHSRRFRARAIRRPLSRRWRHHQLHAGARRCRERRQASRSCCRRAMPAPAKPHPLAPSPAAACAHLADRPAGDHELESLDGSIDYHVVPPLCPLIGSPYDFSHTSELIECARESTDAWLAGGGLERRAIPDQMRPHTHAK